MLKRGLHTSLFCIYYLLILQLANEDVTTLGIRWLAAVAPYGNLFGDIHYDSDINYGNGMVKLDWY